MNRLTNRKTRLAKEGPTMLDIVHKLAEYEDLEEQGLLKKLPCKVGTTVYEIAEDCDCIDDKRGCSKTSCENCKHLYPKIDEHKFSMFMYDLIGKCIFLTKNEAEEYISKNKKYK